MWALVVSEIPPFEILNITLPHSSACHHVGFNWSTAPLCMLSHVICMSSHVIACHLHVIACHLHVIACHRMSSACHRMSSACHRMSSHVIACHLHVTRISLIDFTLFFSAYTWTMCYIRIVLRRICLYMYYSDQSLGGGGISVINQSSDVPPRVKITGWLDIVSILLGQWSTPLEKCQIIWLIINLIYRGTFRYYTFSGEKNEKFDHPWDFFSCLIPCSHPCLSITLWCTLAYF